VTRNVGEESKFAEPRQNYVAVSPKETVTWNLVLKMEDGRNGDSAVDHVREEFRRELALTQAHNLEEKIVKGEVEESVTDMHVIYWYRQTTLGITRMI